jgi:hypothetical protein
MWSRLLFESTLLFQLVKSILASPVFAVLTGPARLGSKDSFSACDIRAGINGGAVAPETSRLAARAAHKKSRPARF